MRRAPLAVLAASFALLAACTVQPDSATPPTGSEQTTGGQTDGAQPEGGEHKKSVPPSPEADPCRAPAVRGDGRDADVAVVPKPAQVEVLMADGYTLDTKTAIGVIGAGDELTAPASLLAALIGPATGLDPRVKTGADGARAPIRLCLSTTAKPESYEIQATSDGVWVTAADKAGAFDAIATLRQLLPPQIESASKAQASWTIPAIKIADRPRYHYRGMMIDVARSFYPPDDLKRVIDTLSLYKLNYLHLHLSDDQGWRIAVPDYPRLTEIGASYQSGGKHGGPWFYTRAQFRDIVAYANARGIGIVPELDGPGHVNAAQTAYAELTCDKKTTEPYTGHDVGFSMYCLTGDANIAAVRSFLTAAWQEVAADANGDYLHFGGDEAMKATPATYGQYVSITSKIATDQGKKLMAWHQFGAYPLPDGAVMQYWGTALENRSIGGAESQSIRELRASLAQGAHVVMSPADRTYVDQCYDTSTPVGASWAGCFTPRMAYEWDPATYVAPANGASIIPADQIDGVEATLFSDHLYKGWKDKSDANFMAPLEYFGYMALPRMPAIAEVAWSQQADREWSDFKARLGEHQSRWQTMGLEAYAPASAW